MRACADSLRSEGAPGTNKAVKARFWPWLGPFSVPKFVHPFEMFPPRSAMDGQTHKPRCDCEKGGAHAREQSRGLGIRVGGGGAIALSVSPSLSLYLCLSVSLPFSLCGVDLFLSHHLDACVFLLLPSGAKGPNSFFQALDLYWCSPESSDVWHESRQLKKTI